MNRMLVLLVCILMVLVGCTKTEMVDSDHSGQNMDQKMISVDSIMESQKTMKTTDDTQETMTQNQNPSMDNKMEVMSSQDKDSGSMDSTTEDQMMMKTAYMGVVLGGTQQAPLLDFTQKDYELALSEGKTIFLYFYANWCPICKAEFPDAITAFNQLSRTDLVGFRVNYKDDETDLDEEALAREFGISYQHTKVIVQNGELVFKDLSSWDKAKYLNTFQTY